jgi:hypothetical protein
MMPERRHGLLPEEDELDDPGDDDGVDIHMPGDLWFRAPLRGMLDVASYTYGLKMPDSQSGSH